MTPADGTQGRGSEGVGAGWQVFGVLGSFREFPWDDREPTCGRLGGGEVTGTERNRLGAGLEE